MSDENPVTLESICLPSDEIVAREIEGELIIVPLTAGIGDMEDELYSLNESGKAIWDRLDGTHTLGQLAADLSREYEAPLADLEQDVIGLMTELAQRKIVKLL